MRSPESPHQHRVAPLTRVLLGLVRALLPYAERDEVIDDLTAEHAHRAATRGRVGARLWLWRQLVGSMPALVRRSWWRAWTMRATNCGAPRRASNQPIDAKATAGRPLDLEWRRGGRARPSDRR